MKAKGKCLCQAVNFSFSIKKKCFDVCHCSMCRRWGGGPALTVEATGDIEFVGEENLATYNSSAWAERGFCQKCGTHLFYRLKGKSFCNFSLGTLEDQEEYTFVTQIYIDDKPANYSFSNDTKMMTEKDVLAANGIVGQ